MIGVSTGIWDKHTPLTAGEWERVRTVPYLTERVLSRQPRLVSIATLAAMSQERMNGSGYPRGLTGNAIPPAARLLAAAAVYQALSEARPHRDALPPAERKATLLAEVSAGRLDAAAVTAVLSAAGHVVNRRASRSKTPRSASCIRASICVGASGCARRGTAPPGSSSSTLS